MWENLKGCLLLTFCFYVYCYFTIVLLFPLESYREGEIILKHEPPILLRMPACWDNENGYVTRIIKKNLVMDLNEKK